MCTYDCIYTYKYVYIYVHMPVNNKVLDFTVLVTLFSLIFVSSINGKTYL